MGGGGGGIGRTLSGAGRSVTNVVNHPTNPGAIINAAANTQPQYDPLNITGLRGGNAGNAGGSGISGQPDYAQYQSFLNPAFAGNLTLPQQLQSRQVLGQEGADLLKQQALSTSASPWAQTLMDKQALATQGQIGNLAQQGNTGLAQANASMARGGGLRGGFSSAMQNQNLQNQMLQGQNIRSQGAQQNLDIQLQDQQQKQGLLQNLVGQDTQANNMNIGNTIGEMGRVNASNLARYGTQMQGWAANQQGNAIANSGKK